MVGASHKKIRIKRNQMLIDAIARISSTRTAFNSQYAARARTNDEGDRALTDESRPRDSQGHERRSRAARSPAAASARLVTTSAHANR